MKLNGMEVVLIHGFGVDPSWHWYAWMKEQLEHKNYLVKAPAMPNPLTPHVSEWVETIMDQIDDPEQTILCGHSLGALSILLYLNIYGGRPFKKVILASTPLGIIEDKNLELFRSFLHAMQEIDWDGVLEVADEFVVLHGEGDMVIPKEHSLELAKHLQVPCVMLPGGHFLQDTFPELLSLFP